MTHKTISEVVKEFEKKFPEGGTSGLIGDALTELEEYGDLHEEHCNCLQEWECNCEMMGMKNFVREKMEAVNNWWLKMTEEHRKYCTPLGNKIITRLKGNKNRLPISEGLHYELLALIDSAIEKIEDEKCDEQKTKAFGEWTAETYEEKMLANAAIKTAITILQEIKK